MKKQDQIPAPQVEIVNGGTFDFLVQEGQDQIFICGFNKEGEAVTEAFFGPLLGSAGTHSQPVKITGMAWKKQRIPGEKYVFKTVATNNDGDVKSPEVQVEWIATNNGNGDANPTPPAPAPAPTATPPVVASTPNSAPAQAQDRPSGGSGLNFRVISNRLDKIERRLDSLNRNVSEGNREELEEITTALTEISTELAKDKHRRFDILKEQGRRCVDKLKSLIETLNSQAAPVPPVPAPAPVSARAPSPAPAATGTPATPGAPAPGAPAATGAAAAAVPPGSLNNTSSSNAGGVRISIGNDVVGGKNITWILLAILGMIGIGLVLAFLNRGDRSVIEIRTTTPAVADHAPRSSPRAMSLSEGQTPALVIPRPIARQTSFAEISPARDQATLVHNTNISRATQIPVVTTVVTTNFTVMTQSTQSPPPVKSARPADPGKLERDFHRSIGIPDRRRYGYDL